jgi:predicted nucleic acid-binding Zn ribbon protein
MARKSNEQSLGDVIKELLKAYRLEGRIKELDVKKAWMEVMGEVVARKTLDVKLRGSILIISLDSGVLKEEFSYNKTRIIEIMNEKLGEDLITAVQIF